MSRITLPSGTPAEVARPPAGTEPKRGLVLIPDIFGLRPLFDDMCARLAAEESWSVCAFELFPGQEDLDIDGRMTAAATLDDERVLGDAVAAAEVVGGGDRVAVLGFCMGGMYALKAAGLGRFDRAVPFYGMIRLPALWKGPLQGEPLELLSRSIATPVLAIVGGKDPYTPDEDVAALEAAGEHVTVARYPEAEHGFVHDPARPAHRPDDAADAWEKVRRFLA
jgi:carboxymethylenebutenolidase